MIAVCSDIHGNVDALEAVMDDMEKRGVSDVICLGDVIGYGGAPQACIRRVREAGWKVLAGNHEEALIYPEVLEYFSPPAAVSIEWTDRQLSSSEKSWVADLPHVLRGEGAEWVHASLDDPLEWEYVLGRREAKLHFQHQTRRVAFCGHTHVAMVWKSGRRIHAKPPSNRRFTIQKSGKTLVNVGAVGQPRDGDNKACYVLYDPLEVTIQFRRIPYDIEAAQEKILRAGLPEFLAERLAVGC